MLNLVSLSGLLKSQSSSCLSNSSQIIDDRCMDDANRKARRWKCNAGENIFRQNICQQMIYVNKLGGYAERMKPVTNFSSF